MAKVITLIPKKEEYEKISSLAKEKRMSMNAFILKSILDQYNTENNNSINNKILDFNQENNLNEQASITTEDLLFLRKLKKTMLGI